MTERIYLDHAATTPMVPQAIEAMTEQFARVGNPSSLHAAGRGARRVVEESRERIAAALGARPSEIVFTSGGTESDNLAVKGLYWSRRAADPRRVRVLASAVEHHAVLDAVEWLAAHEGAKTEWLPVDPTGRLDLDGLDRAIRSDPDSVALITVMAANNEVGTLQPLPEVVALASEHGIPVHTDAVQLVGTLPMRFDALGVDALTFTGHKLGGPFGVGALVVRREVSLTPLTHGGGQERDVRSGTLDAPAIVGLAAAVEWSAAHVAEHAARLAGLRERLVAGVRAAVPDATLNGPEDAALRLPGIAHLTFPDCEGDSLLMLLDARGVECSTGSACQAGVAQPSHVLLAMGRSEEDARSSLRFSLGHGSTEADVDALAAAIGPVVERARAAARVSRR